MHESVSSSGRRHVIVGGSGFIGRHVALALARRGAPVLVADRHAPPPLPGGARLDHVAIDLAGSDLACLVRDGDIVHHYAWSTVPLTANADPLADLETNLRGTVRLLEAMAGRAGTIFLFASSGGTVYGRLRRVPADETHPLDPVTAYGVSKVAAEKYLGFYRARDGLDVRIARISNPYGVGQNPARKQGAASIFVQRALAGAPIEVWGDGGIVRDYLHVSDLAAGLLALAEAPAGRLGASPVFNIGSGTGASIHQLLQALAAALGGRGTPEIRFAPARSFDVPVSVLDIALARARLDWRPRLDLARGLARTIADHAAGAEHYSSLDEKVPSPA